MIVAGTLTNKMAPALRKVYDQMPGGWAARGGQQQEQQWRTLLLQSGWGSHVQTLQGLQVLQPTAQAAGPQIKQIATPPTALRIWHDLVVPPPRPCHHTILR